MQVISNQVYSECLFTYIYKEKDYLDFQKKVKNKTLKHF